MKVPRILPLLLLLSAIISLCVAQNPPAAGRPIPAAPSAGQGRPRGPSNGTGPGQSTPRPNAIVPQAIAPAPAANGSSADQQIIQFQQGGRGCPPLLGNNFPRQQQTLATAQGTQVQCTWVIISDSQGCPQFFQNCGQNAPMCNRQNEIWWQCTSDCEPSCGNPTPNCRQRCGRSGCQCFPGFLRNQNGFCVNSDQCPNSNRCDVDNDCPGSSTICQNGRCQQGCTSNNACASDEECSNGRCVERRNCRFDSQCRDPKVCFSGQCRNVGSIFCRRHFDCPDAAFCGRNGRCFLPSLRSFDELFPNF